MKFTITLFFLLFTYFPNSSTCNSFLSITEPEIIFRDTSSFNDLLSKIKTAKTTQKKVQFLHSDLETSNKFFSSSQILALLSAFNEVAFKEYILTNPLNRYIDSLKTKEIIDIMELISNGHEYTMLNILKSLKDKLDHPTIEEQNTLINHFKLDSYRNVAEVLVKYAFHSDKIFGSFSNDFTVCFIIQNSYSMNQIVSPYSKETRFDIVKSHLIETIKSSLHSSLKFNIISFGGDNASGSNIIMSENYVVAEEDGKNNGIQWVNSLNENKDSHSSNVNLISAIEMAFNTKERVDKIVLVTDGEINSGITDLETIEQRLQLLNGERERNQMRKISINAVLYDLGVSSEMLPHSETIQRKHKIELLEVITRSTHGLMKYFKQ